MEIARIEILKYIRKVKMSESQRIRNYFWDGRSIRVKGKKIPRTFLKNPKITSATGDIIDIPILIEDLKEGFAIAMINKKRKVMAYVTRNEELPISLTAFGLDHPYRYILYAKTVDDIYEPVAANPKKIGTPRFYLINGQDIYSGALQEFERGRVMDAIKDCYRPYIQSLPVITEYPIEIKCEVHDTIKNYYTNRKDDVGTRWDVDNLVYPYLKAFPDLLVKEGKLKDDDRLHMPGSIGAIFIPIDNHEERKLVFIISKVDRPEIVNNEVYNKYHKESFESEDNLLVKDEIDFGIYVDQTQEQKDKLEQVLKIIKDEKI